jgi:hypothetical protein
MEGFASSNTNHSLVQLAICVIFRQWLASCSDLFVCTIADTLSEQGSHCFLVCSVNGANTK